MHRGAFQVVLEVKNTPDNAGDMRDVGLIPLLGISPGEGKGYPLLYSGLENSMDCTIHRVTKSWTRLTNFHFTRVNTISYSCMCSTETVQP